METVAGETVTLEFRRERETPGTVRFKQEVENGRAAIVPTLYVLKSFAKDAAWLTVTIQKHTTK